MSTAAASPQISWLERRFGRSTPFVLRRLHSLSGALPLGVFFIEHLWTNAAALGGQSAFDRAVDGIQSLPGLWALELFGIVLPLLFHAGYGLLVLRSARANLGPYPFERNLAYLLQRVSGVVLLLFIGWHLWEFRVQKLLFGMDASAFYPALTAKLSSTQLGVPWYALAYLVGLLAASFHFANGLYGFAYGWGLAVTRRALRRVSWAASALGVASFVLGGLTVLHFATGPLWAAPALEVHDPVQCEGVVGEALAPAESPPPRQPRRAPHKPLQP